MYQATVTMVGGATVVEPAFESEGYADEVVRLTKKHCLALDEMEALRSGACEVTGRKHEVASVRIDRVRVEPASAFQGEVRVQVIDIELTPDPAFTKSALSRRVRKAGGDYDELRGYMGSRHVRLRPNGCATDETVALLDELMLLPRPGRRPSTVRFVFGADIKSVDGFALHVGEARVAHVRFSPGDSAAKLIELAHETVLKQLGAHIAQVKAGAYWAADPAFAPAHRAHRLASARRRADNARKELADAEAALAALEVQS